MTSQTSSVIWKAFGRTGTSSGVRRAMASWQPPIADAGAQRRELGEIAVAAKAEILARERFRATGPRSETSGCRGRSR